MRKSRPRRGDAPVTMQDIAAEARVSLSTVSRVLSKVVPVARAKRAAVMAAVEALGYRPNVVAQELARGSTRAIGVLPQGLANPFYSRLLKGVEQGLQGTSYYPIFAGGEKPSEEARAFEMLLSHRVEALILMGGQIPDEVLLKCGLPIIAIGRNIYGLEGRCVRVENEEGGYRATRHLIELGHRRIVHIHGLAWHPDALARRQGYERALTEAGITPDPALLVPGDFEEQSGLTGTEKLLEAGIPFTAIFAGNDQMAFGANLALFRRAIKVPGDVSLVGFDDQATAAYSCPPLTTVRQPAVEMGMAAARALVDELRERRFVQPVFAPTLVVRESTAKPPRKSARGKPARATRG